MIVDGGANFTALVRLTNKRGEVLARPGQTCEKVPASSLEWLASARPPKIRRTSEPEVETDPRDFPRHFNADAGDVHSFGSDEPVTLHADQVRPPETETEAEKPARRRTR